MWLKLVLASEPVDAPNLSASLINFARLREVSLTNEELILAPLHSTTRSSQDGGSQRLNSLRAALGQCAAGLGVCPVTPSCQKRNDSSSASSMSRWDFVEPMPWPAS